MDRRLRWLPALAAAVVIFAASVTAGGPDTSQFGPLGLLHVDKYLHATAYAGLGFLVAFALHGWDRRVLAAAFVAALAFGAFVEVVQGFIPYRSMSAYDLAANATGAVLGVLAYRAFAVVWRRVGVRPEFVE